MKLVIDRIERTIRRVYIYIAIAQLECLPSMEFSEMSRMSLASWASS